MNGLDVVERLEALVPNRVGGDWVEVVARAERHRSTLLRRRTFLAIAAAAVLAIPALALANRITEFLTVSAGEAEPPVGYVLSDRVYNVEGKSEHRLEALVTSADLYQQDSPAALSSPDGRQLLYTTSATLRLHDLTTGADRVFEPRGRSAAWRSDGAVAYAKTLHIESSYGHGFGHVYVRATPDAAPTRWTELPSRYTVIAWAGDELLVSALSGSDGFARRIFGVPQADEGVYALSGPGRVRRLPLVSVAAVDPTGTLAIGPTTSDHDLPATGEFRVVRVSDGQGLAEIALPPIVTPEMPYAEPVQASGGSWAGDYIVVGFSSAQEGDALVVLRFENGELTPEHVFRLDERSAKAAGLTAGPFTFGSLYDPRFLDNGRKILARGTVNEPVDPSFGAPSASAFLVCDRVNKRCERSKRLPRSGWFEQIFVIENPSRPLD